MGFGVTNGFATLCARRRKTKKLNEQCIHPHFFYWRQKGYRPRAITCLKSTGVAPSESVTRWELGKYAMALDIAPR